MNDRIKKLKTELKKLEEASGSLGKGTGRPNPSAAKEGSPSDHSAGTRDTPGFTSTDTNSKAVKDHPRGNGVHVQGTPKLYDPKSVEHAGAKGTVKKVAREEGAPAGVKEVGKGGEKIGSAKEVELANKVAREEGSTAGAKHVGEYGNLSSFRARIRDAFGLPLDDAKNKGNSGL
jgi:hypothetical protein